MNELTYKEGRHLWVDQLALNFSPCILLTEALRGYFVCLQ